MLSLTVSYIAPVQLYQRTLDEIPWPVSATPFDVFLLPPTIHQSNSNTNQ